MLQVPIDKYEQHLTDWLAVQLRSGEYSGRDEIACSLLLRISKAQMVQRNRGAEYPFIEELKLTPEEYNLVEHYGWKKSDNVEVRAYCLDICLQLEKDKREIKREASDAYLELYKRVQTPWYLIRSVVVRFFKEGNDKEYLEEVINICPTIHGSWLSYVSEKLAKDCKDNLDDYIDTLEGMIAAAKGNHNWYDAVVVLDALFAFKRMPREQYHLRKALLYEEEFDYRLATQNETTYNMKLDSIQNAHKEISKIKNKYPNLYNQIRNKMIKEQKVFAEKLQIFGVKDRDVIPESVINSAKSYLKENPITNPVQLILALRTIQFPKPKHVKTLSVALVNAHPMLYMSFGNTEAIGEKGQTLGRADTETSLKITVHKRLRNRIHYIVECLLIDYLKHDQSMDEEALGQGIFDACNVNYIEDSRKVLWAKGIVEGCKGDLITASHILMPQIEHALVVKAEQYCGDLTNYERDRHDQATLERVLTSLKPHMKGVLYDEMSFFLNNGADVNFRNKIAHGLIGPDYIEEQGIYLWWLAIKMMFCENEIFKKR